jgi:hypothetical protein
MNMQYKRFSIFPYLCRGWPRICYSKKGSKNPRVKCRPVWFGSKESSKNKVRLPSINIWETANLKKNRNNHP